jgi:hypothetical protein
MIAFFILLLKSLCGSQVGMKNVKTNLYCIYCKVKTKIKEKDAILLDQGVHVCGIYIVANLILLCSLEICLSYFELDNFSRAYGLSFYTFFLFLLLLGHLSIFLILYFCIATYLPLALGIWREDNYKELWAFIPNKYFCGFSQYRSKTFLSGWTSMFLHTPSVGAADICGVYVILILKAW